MSLSFFWQLGLFSLFESTSTKSSWVGVFSFTWFLSYCGSDEQIGEYEIDSISLSNWDNWEKSEDFDLESRGAIWLKISFKRPSVFFFNYKNVLNKYSICLTVNACFFHAFTSLLCVVYAYKKFSLISKCLRYLLGILEDMV